MSITNTEWIAVKDDETECRADTKQQLTDELLRQGKDVDGYDLLKVPKPAYNMFV